MNRSVSYLILAFISLLIVSCQKEPDESILNEPAPAVCRLIKAESLDNGSVTDTAGYTYTNDKITRVSYTDFYNVFDYSGTKMTKRSYFENGNLSGYDTILYNGDGTIRKLETYLTNAALPMPILFLEYVFTYSGSKLVKLVEKADTLFTGGGPVALYEYDYTYSGNNITRAVEKDYVNATTDTLNYQYDNLSNYYKNNFLTDLFLSELNGQLLPMAFSANNVILLSQGGDSYILSYTLDSKKNLSEFLIDGEAFIRYSYKCQ
jgi:hypothetical protein